jgi:hypothetical protein
LHTKELWRLHVVVGNLILVSLESVSRTISEHVIHIAEILGGFLVIDILARNLFGCLRTIFSAELQYGRLIWLEMHALISLWGPMISEGTQSGRKLSQIKSIKVEDITKKWWRLQFIVQKIRGPYNSSPQLGSKRKVTYPVHRVKIIAGAPMGSRWPSSAPS